MKFLIPVFCLALGCKNTHPTEKNNELIYQTQSNDSYKEAEIKRLKSFAVEAKNWCTLHHYNNQFFFLADMALPSGKKRFFVYDLTADTIVSASLVAHGCCNQSFLRKARFSNEKGCGCSSFGRYKIGGKYKGRYGTAYKLAGLDSSNVNAAERNIVLHSYPSVPDAETYPEFIGNSYGCPMVSERFLKVLETKIDSSAKPVLLWIAE